MLHDVRGKAGGRRPERGGEISLRVDVDGQHPLARARREKRQRSRDRAPAGPTLSRDEDDPPRKQRREIDPLSSDRAPNRR